jgi:hypothetical protein
VNLGLTFEKRNSPVAEVTWPGSYSILSQYASHQTVSRMNSTCPHTKRDSVEEEVVFEMNSQSSHAGVELFEQAKPTKIYRVKERSQ